MMRRLRDFAARNIVATVPDELDLCLTCKRPTCTAAEFRVCALRLERLADLRARAAAPRRADDRASEARPASPGA